MGAKSSSSSEEKEAPKRPAVASGCTMLLLTTHEGIVVPVEEKTGVMGSISSLFSSSTPTVYHRPCLQPTQKATTSAYACFSLADLARSPGEPIRYGDAVMLRFNHDGGACLRVDSSSKAAQRLCVHDANFDTAVCTFVVFSASGQSPGTVITEGDLVSLQVQGGPFLSLVPVSDGFELQACVKSDGGHGVFALQPASEPASSSAAPPSSADTTNMFAAGAVGAAGALLAADKSGKLLNEAAVVMAPHVQRAAQERYGGADGTKKMFEDADTAMKVGQSVANNPAARAAASTLFSAVASGAVAAMSAQDKSKPRAR